MAAKASYGNNPNAGVDPNADHGWGGWQWPVGVPGYLLATANYKAINVIVRKELVELFQLLFQITEALGYDIWTHNPNGNGEVWGPWSYENRKIGGSFATPSNHSKAKAIDINAPYNPQSHTFQTNLPPEVVSAWEQCGFFWGGRYNGVTTKYDTMHFEYSFSPADVAGHVAKARSILANLGGTSQPAPGVPAPSTPAPSAPAPAAPAFPLPSGYYYGPRSGPKESVSGYVGDSAWREGLRVAQRRLNEGGDHSHMHNMGLPPLDVDGLYGPATAKAITAYQTARHGAPFNLGIDGKLGPATWASLWK